jgi:ABC-type transport system involved in multi-copper enzyme maturation permease subunit
VIGVLRSELVKQRSTRTTLLLFAAMFALVAFAVALHVLALGADQLSTRSHQLEVFQVGTRAGMLFAGLIGVIAFTAEVRYGTIRPTFLVTPRRGRVITAKLAVSGFAGIAFGLVAEALMAAAAGVAFAARGIENELTASDYLQLLVGGAAAAALWAAIGLGVGAVIRNQVGAVVGLCVWILLVESTSDTFVPGAARFLPGGVALTLAGNVDDLSVAVAALVLVLYAAATLAAGLIATLGRDVA